MYKLTLTRHYATFGIENYHIEGNSQEQMIALYKAIADVACGNHYEVNKFDQIKLVCVFFWGNSSPIKK